MYLDYRRLREEQIVRENGPSCACGQRLWLRESVRDFDRRRFRCSACLTLLDLPATFFQARDDQGQPSGQAEDLGRHPPADLAARPTLPMRLVIACALAAALLAGCAKRDMDECRKGDRSRCPGEASDVYRQRG